MKEYIYWRDDAPEEAPIQGGMFFRSMKMGKFIKECEDKGYKMMGIKFDESNNCEFIFIPPKEEA
jgi:hypothetical protein